MVESVGVIDWNSVYGFAVDYLNQFVESPDVSMSIIRDIDSKLEASGVKDFISYAVNLVKGSTLIIDDSINGYSCLNDDRFIRLKDILKTYLDINILVK